MGPVWVAVSVHAEAHHPRARAELRLVLSSMCENALGGAVQAKHPLLTFVFFKWSTSRKSADVETNKETFEPKLKGGNENYGYSAGEPRTMREGGEDVHRCTPILKSF